MKLKIIITGFRVHEIGCKYCLMSNAIDLGLRGFQARNRMSGMVQEVIAFVEGDEEAVAEFKALVKSQKPEHSEVSDATFEEHEGEVMRAGEYAQVCTAVQMNKAIPVLLEIRDDMKEMKGDMKAVKVNTDAIPQIHEEIKGLRDEVQPGLAMQLEAGAVRYQVHKGTSGNALTSS